MLCRSDYLAQDLLEVKSVIYQLGCTTCRPEDITTSDLGASGDYLSEVHKETKAIK